MRKKQVHSFYLWRGISTFAQVKDLNTSSPHRYELAACQSPPMEGAKKGRGSSCSSKRWEWAVNSHTYQELKGLQCSLLRYTHRYFHSAAFHLSRVTGAQALAYDDIVLGPEQVTEHDAQSIAHLYPLHTHDHMHTHPLHCLPHPIIWNTPHTHFPPKWCLFLLLFILWQPARLPGGWWIRLMMLLYGTWIRKNITMKYVDSCKQFYIRVIYNTVVDWNRCLEVALLCYTCKYRVAKWVEALVPEVCFPTVCD